MRWSCCGGVEVGGEGCTGMALKIKKIKIKVKIKIKFKKIGKR
jgi:hypothetical protein